MIHVFEIKTVDSAHKGTFSSVNKTFSVFLARGSRYEASVEATSMPTTLGR